MKTAKTVHVSVLLPFIRGVISSERQLEQEDNPGLGSVLQFHQGGHGQGHREAETQPDAPSELDTPPRGPGVLLPRQQRFCRVPSKGTFQ